MSKLLKSVVLSTEIDVKSLVVKTKPPIDSNLPPSNKIPFGLEITILPLSAFIVPANFEILVPTTLFNTPKLPFLKVNV